jgi:hypothetical protein
VLDASLRIAGVHDQIAKDRQGKSKVPDRPKPGTHLGDGKILGEGGGKCQELGQGDERTKKIGPGKKKR